MPVVVLHPAEREESQPLSPVSVLITKELGLKVNMQSLVLMMHESGNILSLMSDTL